MTLNKLIPDLSVYNIKERKQILMMETIQLVSFNPKSTNNKPYLMNRKLVISNN